MTDIDCQLEHAIEVEVSPAFAWNWRTDINNWNDPPARFELDGPFAAGSWGTTRFPGQDPIRWQVRDVQPGVSFTIEMPLDGAVLSLSGCSKPRTTGPESRSELSSRATTPPHTLIKFEPASVRPFLTE